jgi:hypothetical protein
MYMQTPSQREQWRQIMARKERDTRAWVSENFDETEEYSIVRDPSGLGFRVGFRSLRAKELFTRLHRDVFSPGFAQPNLSLEESGVWTAWFGYLDLERVNIPTHFISMS